MQACSSGLQDHGPRAAMAPHVIWTEFSPNRKASGVRHATGYPIEVLEHAWGDKYRSALIRAVYRYPGFEVIARARDRRKLGKFVASLVEQEPQQAKAKGGAHHVPGKKPPDVAGPGMQELPGGYPGLHGADGAA